MKLLVLLVCVGVAIADMLYIFGGDDVTQAGKYPHQGSLKVNGKHYCGISLISSTWGLTTASCVDEHKVSEMIFQFGSNNRTKGGQIVKAKTIKMHEDYGYSKNDIAVVQFAENVTAPNANPIPLAAAGSDHAGNTDCWITGWGLRTFLIWKLPKILREAKINVYTNEVCKNDWGSRINPGHICIGDKVNRKGPCNGDNGGPLICKVNDHYELVGAASWGIFGCNTDYPYIYTRISYFRKWIKDNSGV